MDQNAIATAIGAHAAALLELAAAIRDHTDAIMQGEDAEEQAPQTYMDGTPVR